MNDGDMINNITEMKIACFYLKKVSQFEPSFLLIQFYLLIIVGGGIARSQNTETE